MTRRAAQRARYWLTQKGETALTVAPERAGRDGGEAVLTRNDDGTLTLSWPHGRGPVVPCTPEAIEQLVDAHNAARAALARVRDLCGDDWTGDSYVLVRNVIRVLDGGTA